MVVQGLVGLSLKPLLWCVAALDVKRVVHGDSCVVPPRMMP